MRHYNRQRMIFSPAVQSLSLASAPLNEVDADLLILPFFDSDSLDDVPGLEAGSNGYIRQAIETKELQGRLFEFFTTPLSGWKARRVALVGAGKRADFDIERLRKDGGPFAGCSPLEELDPQVLQPYAISEPDEDIRAYLVEVIYEHRRPDSAPFLARMLNDPSKEVWKAALNGLVLLGLPVVRGGLGIDAALVALKAARTGASAEQLECIDEAIDLIEHPEA